MSKVKESLSAKEEFSPTPEKLAEYPGSDEIQSIMESAMKYANNLGVPQVVRVSESRHAVCGIPHTFVKLENSEGKITLHSVKLPLILVGGKQLKYRHMHDHLLSCCLDLWR